MIFARVMTHTFSCVLSGNCMYVMFPSPWDVGYARDSTIDHPVAPYPTRMELLLVSDHLPSCVREASQHV